VLADITPINYPAGIVRVKLEADDPALSQQSVDFAIEIIANRSLGRAAKQVTPEE